MKNRTLEISHTSGLEVTKKEATCFTHQLVKDASNPQGKRMYKWQLDNNTGNDAGSNAFCCEGLADGSYMKLCTVTEDGKSGIQFSFFKNGELWYTATELDGDSVNDMHLACLHRLVKKIAQVPKTESEPEQNPLAELAKKAKPKTEEYCIKVGDVFRSIDVDELVVMVLDQPTILSLGVAHNSPEKARIEALIRSIVSFFQHVKPRETAVLMQSFGLTSLADGSHCGHLVTSPLPKVANAYVKFNERYYGGLSPAQRNLKFAADIVINLLVGV